jgi:hypothetical protein
MVPWADTTADAPGLRYCRGAGQRDRAGGGADGDVAGGVGGKQCSASHRNEISTEAE